MSEEDGFTILEALLALAVISFAAAVVLTGMRTSSMTVAGDVRDQEVTLLARSILASVGPDIPLMPSVRTGTQKEDLTWTLTLKGARDENNGFTLPDLFDVRLVIEDRRRGRMAEFHSLKWIGHRL